MCLCACARVSVCARACVCVYVCARVSVCVLPRESMSVGVCLACVSVNKRLTVSVNVLHVVIDVSCLGYCIIVLACCPCQLGDVLGDDYERKMTVVATLKQYAEDRDIDILCRSLDAILTTPGSRSILRHIRSAGAVGPLTLWRPLSICRNFSFLLLVFCEDVRARL